ncbi:beta-Ig-H3/fasciclin repeat containing protein [Advenella kashmirensis WT001]|uniref:Beta-Ig-H3/fasciclin repeat containing protein n=1 Tax=Advenella kashmirensis (strain DSM 17095 / LMG 22695 / WT001) TaxID=1036672 RepID=I3UER7_ADVKW|nr:beta-Ig-H3/fasciclin repeat containing protein [Advenella kashmirensis WT001]
MKKLIRSLVLTSMLTGMTIAGAATINVGGSPMLATKKYCRKRDELKRPYHSGRSRKSSRTGADTPGKGPYTVFAPTNAAFNALPAGTVETLLKPEHKQKLTAVLTYHVVAGKYTKNDLEKIIKKDGGKAMLKTVQGGTLWLMMNGPQNIQIKDEAGAMANISTYDVMQSNGVINVIDTVLMPK